MEVDELWHLRPELEYSHQVDSWNIRDSTSLQARVVGVLRAGQPFQVISQAGDWVQIKSLDNVEGWSYTKFGDVVALVPTHRSAEAVMCDYRAASALGGTGPLTFGLPNTQARQQLTLEQHMNGLLQELDEGRDALVAAEKEAVNLAADSGAVVRAASVVENIMAKLELLGAAEAEITEALGDELNRHESFAHMDFLNPDMKSCWLSTFFQSLWHSRVFHALFDSLVRPLPAKTSNASTASSALRETWELYENSAKRRTRVSVKALVRFWGSDFGDCSEAFGTLNGDPLLEPLAQQLALVPVVQGDAIVLPPARLWSSVVEMGVTSSPIIVLDLQLGPMASDVILMLAQNLVPRTRRGELVPELGDDHRLVAMICYIDDYEHYVVFCRRQSGVDSWLFFNDLPGGPAYGALRELDSWCGVAHECARFQLRPKLLLYESTLNAEMVVKNSATLRKSVEAVAEATINGTSRPRTEGTCRQRSSVVQGARAALIALLVAMVLQQLFRLWRQFHK